MHRETKCGSLGICALHRARVGVLFLVVPHHRAGLGQPVHCCLPAVCGVRSSWPVVLLQVCIFHHFLLPWNSVKFCSRGGIMQIKSTSKLGAAWTIHEAGFNNNESIHYIHMHPMLHYHNNHKYQTFYPSWGACWWWLSSVAMVTKFCDIGKAQQSFIFVSSNSNWKTTLIFYNWCHSTWSSW